MIGLKTLKWKFINIVDVLTLLIILTPLPDIENANHYEHTHNNEENDSIKQTSKANTPVSTVMEARSLTCWFTFLDELLGKYHINMIQFIANISNSLMQRL